MAEEQKMTSSILSFFASLSLFTAPKPAFVNSWPIKTPAAKTTKIVTKTLLDDAQNGFKSGNFVGSPFSLEILLGMLAYGAEGKTLKQLLGFLGVETMDQLRSESPSSILLKQIYTNPNDKEGSLDSSLVKESNKANEINLANGVWADKTLNFVQPCYEEVLRTVYRTKARFVDFKNRSKSAGEINSWVNKKTRGLIHTIVEDGDLEDVAFVLVNALYFKGIWSEPFDVYGTAYKDYYLINGGTVSVPFMTSKKQFNYGSFDGFKILQLPYKSDHISKMFSMYIFLPDKIDGLQDLLRMFDSNHALFHATFDLSSQNFKKLLIPKFKISYKFAPKDVMKQMGLRLPFDRMNRELTRIVDPEGLDSDKLYVSDILQQSIIEVDEKGTVACAVTAMGGRWGYKPPPPVISFVADHPFMFIIREETSRAVFFMGVVLNPTAE